VEAGIQGEGNRAKLDRASCYNQFIPTQESHTMSSKVGTKGQIVIEKAIRDKLGIEPGSLAVQRIVDGRVEIIFFPPEHNRSLAGVLAPYIKRRIAPGREWDEAREMAWEAEAKEKMERLNKGK
jgi:AbrB family looped-hinge helix DNA binding protein